MSVIGRYGIRRAGVGRFASARIVERNVRAYRRTWLIFVSGLFEPVLYLLSIGVGVGELVGDLPGPNGREISYAQFVAPAMLVTASMTGAVADTSFNFFAKFKYAHAYDAMLATPLGIREVARGEVGWAVLRGGLYAASFFLVMVPFGLVPSWWGPLSVPAAMLVGFAFASVAMWFTTFMRSFVDFDYVFLIIIPLFLLSATFYPLSRYPDWVEPIVRLTPLYQGVALSRAAVLGDMDIALLGHVLYLAAMGCLGLELASRRLSRLLLP